MFTISSTLKQIRLIGLFLVSVYASALSANELSYIDILKSLTPDQNHIVTQIPELAALQQARTAEEARRALENRYILREAEAAQAGVGADRIQALVKRKPITFVVVPGVLGEFIDGRAFEEIFSGYSSFKTQWQQLAERSGITDERFNLHTFAPEQNAISDLINAASVDDASGRPLFKLIILKTPFGSLESVGSNEDKARIFNRRLQKYYELTGDQNLVLLGYSRGTPLALEMVVQAERNRLSYLSQVKTIVSYAGVVMGSALADVTEDPTSQSGILLAGARTLLNDLQFSESLSDRAGKLRHNARAFAQFARTMAANSGEMDAETFLSNARAGDFRTVAALIVKMATELGLRSVLDFNGHVSRMKMFITEILIAVDGLKSKNLEAWWRANTLPKNIRYVSLAAAMVDPEQSDIEREIYEAREGYNDTLDDRSLLGNKRTYQDVTGVALNDSQVAVYQSLFLPTMIAQLNPANAGLNIETLGLLQTHHWGVALQTVNRMRDGRLNPFPREKVLLALAAYLNQ